MSIIVSVKIHDGIVMAADSATTFYSTDGRPGQIYEHANKIVNLVKGLPIGVMTCGSGGVANASIATLLKDLRDRLTQPGDATESALAADWIPTRWKKSQRECTASFLRKRTKRTSKPICSCGCAVIRRGAHCPKYGRCGF